MTRGRKPVPFNRPHLTGPEIDYIKEAIANGHLSGNGPFTQRCQALLERTLGAAKTLITHSCTAALEMAALLADLRPGDEVIMPSYTFVSTANAFVLRGAVPVFVDIRPDTLNIDEELIEQAVTPRTRAIAVVHYAGVGCAMDRIMALADRFGLLVIEDAAQGMGSTYRGVPLGRIAPMAALSFHETKNVISGEGGALVLNASQFADRAEILWEKGTNRARFFRGEIDKYTWTDIGSSYAPSEIIAAFLLAQLEREPSLTARRLELWHRYHDAFAEAESSGVLRRPIVPPECRHNALLYYLLVRDRDARERVLRDLRSRGFHAVFHYVPLHSSPGGRRFARTASTMAVTNDVADRLIRLPLYHGLGEDEQQGVIASVLDLLVR